MVSFERRPCEWYLLVTVDSLALEEVQSVDYSAVIRVALSHISMTSSKVRREEAETRIVVVEADAHCAFVA